MDSIADVARRDAKWSAFGALACLFLFWRSDTPLALAAAGFLAAEAALLWHRKIAGPWLALAGPVLLAAGAAWLLADRGFSWGRLAMLLFMPLGFWAHWSSYGDLIRGKAGWDEAEDEDDRLAARVRGGSGEDDDSPMTSIVLLRSKAKLLDSAILLECVREAWDPRRELGDDDLFVAGEGPVLMVKSPQGMWMVHNHSRPYFDDDYPVDRIPELRLRKAVADHAAWLSVDLMHGFEENLPREVYYPFIFRLIRELSDDDTLAIFRPESGEINVWSDEVAASLGSIDPLEGFATPVHSPVIQVSDEDPRMKAAVEEARRTFSVFRGHWDQRDSGDSFLAKVSLRRDGNSEVIWIEVDGLEPDFIHGTLANQPVNLTGLNSGDRIEVPVADLYDWAIALEGAEGPLGLFTDKIVLEVQREARAALEKRPGGEPQA
jgi:uncharacterized protein YegJ (DUF2314 family)